MLRTLVIILSVYLIPEGLVMIWVISKSMGLLVIMSALIPYIITVLTFLFFTIAGIRNLMTHSPLNIKLLQIALLIQSFQVTLLGFSYVNYCGPYAGLGFTTEPSLSLTTQINLLAFRFDNGFGNDPAEITVSVNLVFFILYYIIRRLKRKAETVERFSFE